MDSRRGRGTAAVAAAALAAGVGLTGCHLGNVNISGALHNATASKKTVDQFASVLKSGQTPKFVVTYVTTGATPTLVTYAVAPPNDTSFSEAPVSAPGQTQTDLISNVSGAYSCQSGGTAAPVTCTKLGKLSAAGRFGVTTLYTPLHYVTLLRSFAVLAGLGGGKVTLSTMTVNGFSLRCINVKTPADKQPNTICTTKQNLLGYARLDGDTTAFEIKSYSASPPPGLFALPRGARVSTGSSQAG
jgi:hypothetical protein